MHDVTSHKFINFIQIKHSENSLYTFQFDFALWTFLCFNDVQMCGCVFTKLLSNVQYEGPTLATERIS